LGNNHLRVIGTRKPRVFFDLVAKEQYRLHPETIHTQTKADPEYTQQTKISTEEIIDSGA
jgi:hypothetical protein